MLIRTSFAAPVAGAPPAGGAVGAAVLDADALARLRALDPRGDNRLMQRVLEAFDSSAARLVAQLDAALAQDPIDTVAVRHVVHTMKSASASIGALALSRRCAAMEIEARDGRTATLADDADALRAELAAVLKVLPDVLA
jgi:HPt (histidine-containing phosphotransfer) domain-containing protein